MYVIWCLDMVASSPAMIINQIDITNKSAYLFSAGVAERLREFCYSLQQFLGISHFGYLKIYHDCSYQLLMNGQNNGFLEKFFENIATQDPLFQTIIKNTTFEQPSSFYLFPTKFDKLPPVIYGMGLLFIIVLRIALKYSL